ncbi:hypothetical protein C8R44DRAFT_865691 [Mycena epipterygia]|nr:hypothetical protein C8R44DRAFT_865691 [Mycena epipterygia]
MRASQQMWGTNTSNGSMSLFGSALRQNHCRFGSPMMTQLTIPQTPVLTTAQSSALITALDLQDRLPQLKIDDGYNLRLPELMQFVHRYQKLKALSLKHGAINTVSLSEGSVKCTVHRPAKLYPSPHQRRILPLQPRVQRLSLVLAGDLHDESHDFDDHIYGHAVYAIAALPDPALIALILSLALRPVPL